MSPSTNIESLQAEGRIFNPPDEFAEKAYIKSMAELEALRSEGKADPEKFWARFAESELHWFKKWDKVLKWEPQVSLEDGLARTYRWIETQVKQHAPAAVSA